jgi:SAM-dependent methyltransferase
MDPSKFTGERPGWGEGFEYDYARHVAAYAHAATLAAGRRVLDAGCGEGFGTHTMADVAAEVVGVDYSDAAIAECRRLWNKPNLRFEQVDLTRPGTFTDTFDLVLNFQVVEHIQDPLPFLRGLHQRLAPGGTLMLTTPNRLRTVSENPFHVREYTAPELAELLGRVFGSVEMLGMHGNDKVERFEEGRARAVARILRLDPLGIRNLLPRAVVDFAFAKLARIVRRQAAPDGGAAIVVEDFSVKAGGIDRALDLVALCRA